MLHKTKIEYSYCLESRQDIRHQIAFNHYNRKQQGRAATSRGKKKLASTSSSQHDTVLCVPQKGKMWFWHFHTGIFSTNVHKQPTEVKNCSVWSHQTSLKFEPKSGPSCLNHTALSFEEMIHENCTGDY